MATKSEQYKASTQRSAAAKRSAKKKPSRAKTRPRAKPTKTAKTTIAHGNNKGTAKKAAYVLEHAEGGAHPSRKSTRASAHHGRLDSSLALRQEDRARAPDSQFRRAKAKASRVRGKG